jgi:flagellin
VTVEVTQSAQRGQLVFAGATTSATTVEIRGNSGAQVLSFISGTTLAEVAAAVNDATATTGVTATVSAVGSSSALVLNSQRLGSDAFLTVLPIGGNFIQPGTEGQLIRDVGQDAGVIINGIRAGTKGVVADVRTLALDARVYLTEQFAQSLSSATFTITGGGALFQITPQMNPNGQVHMAFNSVRTTTLGDSTVGLLYTLRSGQPNDLAGKNFPAAQAIINRAIDQISTYRGRLGNAQRNQIDPAINSQTIAIENVTASESVVRDADMAAEVSALTRAQILVQSTQRTLLIANSAPQQVLALLE